jgi:hypothetical protein
MIQLREKLLNCYEAVRVYAIGRNNSTVLPEGLALIMARGIPDWMNTWSHVLPANKAKRPKAKAEAVEPLNSIRSQMTVVLARMVINSVADAVSC